MMLLDRIIPLVEHNIFAFSNLFESSISSDQKQNFFYSSKVFVVALATNEFSFCELFFSFKNDL